MENRNFRFLLHFNEIFQGAQDRYFHLMAMSNGPEMGNRLGRVVKFTETPLSADRDLPVAERENYKRVEYLVGRDDYEKPR